MLYTNLDDFVCCLLVAGNVNVIFKWVERAVYHCTDVANNIEHLHFVYHKIPSGSKDGCRLYRAEGEHSRHKK